MPGYTYYFAIVPVDASGNSDSTVNTVSAAPEDTAAPEDITNLTAAAGYDSVNGNYVTLTWTPSLNSKGDLADQIIYFDNGTGYDSGTSLGGAATTYTKNNLLDATLYKFKVVTKDTANHESAGIVKGAVTRLQNPMGLSAVPGNGKATLSWSALNSEYVKEYRVYRAESPTQFTDTGTMAFIKSLTGTGYTDTGLVNGTTYQYAVTVLNMP